MGDTKAPQDEDQKGAEGKDHEAQGEDHLLLQRAGLEVQLQARQGQFKSCHSPFKAKVDHGKHKFQVFAIDPAGNADPTPAKAKFKRVERATATGA